ncbi:hypothetical protein NX029_26080 [Cytobacillus firmus]|nr:hypothetical protein [Cytobacillus firmus]
MARVSMNLSNLNRVKRDVKSAVEEAVHDVTDDLVRTSSETAPHWKGILEQSYGKSVTWRGNQCVGVVDYSVKEDGFDYAVWIHEGEYQLGEKSEEKASAGGGVGMSGKSYPVGNKFLTRPLYGEAETYRKHIQSVVDENLK